MILQMSRYSSKLSNLVRREGSNKYNGCLIGWHECALERQCFFGEGSVSFGIVQIDHTQFGEGATAAARGLLVY